MPAHPLSLREGQRAPSAHRLSLTNSQIATAAGDLGRALHTRSLIAPGPALGASRHANVMNRFGERINLLLGH